MADFDHSGNGPVIRVLHVDDDSSFLEVSKQLLLDINDNLQIDLAFCVDDALNVLSKNSFDVIVSDYEMPQKNGLDFLQALIERKIELPFILFTGKGREEVAIQALNLGADGYINKQGNPETVFGELAHGIRLAFARRQSELRSKEEESLRSILLDNLPCTALILEKNTRKIVASNRIAQNSGAIPGRKCYVTCADRDTPCTFCLAPKVWETNQPQTLEVEYKGKYYRGVWVPYSEELYAHYIFDISELKVTQDQLKESLLNYQSLINGMSETAWVVDFKGNFLEVNDAAVELLGYSKEELLSGGIAKIDKHLSKKQVQELINNLVKKKKQTFETVHTSKAGLEIPVEISSSVITYRGEQVILSIARNITERKKAEALMHSKEQRWATTVKSIGDAVITADADGKIEFMNSIAEELTGWTNKEALAKPLAEVFRIVNEENRLPLEDPAVKVIKTGHIVGLANHTILLKKDGGEIPIDDSGAPIFDDEGRIIGVVLIFRDITNRRALENELAVSQKKYKSLFSEMSEGVCLHEMIYDGSGKAIDYKILDINRAYETITGLTRKKAIGQKASILYGTKPAPYLEIYAKVADSGKSTCFETFFPPMQKHFRISVYSPEKNKFATVFIDITESKRAEEQIKSNNQKLKNINEKLQVVGSLTRHDVSNKLMIAKSNAFLLKKKIGDQPELIKYLEAIEISIDQSKQIFEFARLYEQVGSEEPHMINVGQCFNRAVALAGSLKTVKFRNDCTELNVMADSMLSQLLYTLIDNSLSHGQTVTQIRLYCTPEGASTKLFYEDNGVGISKENKDRIFKDGFTTGKGLGIGLKLVKRLMEVYGWTIKEVGASGKGAKFEITIPNAKI